LGLPTTKFSKVKRGSKGAPNSTLPTSSAAASASAAAAAGTPAAGIGAGGASASAAVGRRADSTTTSMARTPGRSPAQIWRSRSP
jgi:hypothetical protein